MANPISPAAEALPVGWATTTAAQTMLGSALGVLGPFAFGVGIIQTLSARHGRIKKESPVLKSQDKESIAKDKPVPVLYGQKKVIGQIIYRENTPDQLFDMAVGLCEGEISAITDVRVNGRVAEEVGETSYTAYLGTGTQEADSRFTDGQASIGCEADAYVDETAKDTAHNSGLLIVSQGSWTSLTSNLAPGTRRVYTRFNVSGANMPAGLNITSAQVRIQKSTIPGNTKKDIKGYGTTGEGAETWDETTLTWNNAPSRGAQYVASTTVSQGGSWVDLVLNDAGLAALKAAYAAGTKFSLEIAPDDDEILSFKSKESEFVEPTLIVHYSGATPNAFRYLSYLAMTIDNRTGLAGGNYPTVEATALGALIRTWDGATYTTEYSNNPAWVIYDILTHSRRGLGLADSLFNADSFKTVADYCDVLVTRPDGLTEARYRCDAIFDSRNRAFEAIETIMAAAGMFVYNVDGEICLGIEKNEDVSHAFTMDNIVKDSFTYSVLDRFDVANIIRASYTEPAEDFKEVYVQSESETDRVDYGDKILDISLLTVNRKWEAVRRAHWLLWRGLLTEYMCKFRVSINNADVAPGDVCSVTHDLPGWSVKQFRIIEVREYSDDEIELTCQQYIAKTDALETNLPNVAYVESVGGGGVVAEQIPAAPVWTITGEPGGWTITVTGPISGAVSYTIYQFNEDNQQYTNIAGMIFDGRSDAAQASTSLTTFLRAPDQQRRTWSSYKLRTHSLTKQSELSAAQGAWAQIKNPANFIPTAPYLSTDGYPVISKIAKYNAFSFMVRNLIIVNEDEADSVGGYELRRRDDGGTGKVTWSAWQVLPDKVLMDMSTPNPHRIIYDNTDHLFVPGYYYEYQTRAIGLNQKPSAWSDTLQMELTDDTTAPDKPVATYTDLTLMVRIDIEAATQDGGPCPDFSHWKIEKSDNAGSSWETLQAEWRGTVYLDADIDANLDTNRRYRITAYDYSGNASTVSDSSTDKKKVKVGYTSLADGAVTPDKANLSLQGWQTTCVFSASDYNTVAWDSGLLITGDGTQYSIAAGNTGNMTAAYRHFIYFDVAVSTTALQVTTTAATAIGSGKVMVAAAYPVTDTGKKAEFQMFGGVGTSLRIVTADWIAADAITANEIAANTITANEIASGTITTTQLNFTPVTGTNVIASINASAEGGGTLNIDAAKIAISGSCTFSSGYDPTTKLNHTGGAYNTAASGARVRIFPDANTGILATDGTNDVFKVMVGGTDVGDVIIGSAAGQYVKWDKSASQLLINGLLTSSGGIKTAASGSRIELGTFDSAQRLRIYSGSVQCVDIRLASDEPVFYINNSDEDRFVQIDTDGFVFAEGSWSLLSPYVKIAYNASYGGGYIQTGGVNGPILGDNLYLYSLGSNAIYYDGNKVIGAQGAPVADATGAGDVVAQLNALLARCRAHGLIAT